MSHVWLMFCFSYVRHEPYAAHAFCYSFFFVIFCGDLICLINFDEHFNFSVKPIDFEIHEIRNLEKLDAMGRVRTYDLPICTRLLFQLNSQAQIGRSQVRTLSLASSFSKFLISCLINFLKKIMKKS